MSNTTPVYPGQEHSAETTRTAQEEATRRIVRDQSSHGYKLVPVTEVELGKLLDGAFLKDGIMAEKEPKESHFSNGIVLRQAPNCGWSVETGDHGKFGFGTALAFFGSTMELLKWLASMTGVDLAPAQSGPAPDAQDEPVSAPESCDCGECQVMRVAVACAPQSRPVQTKFGVLRLSNPHGPTELPQGAAVIDQGWAGTEYLIAYRID